MIATRPERPPARARSSASSAAPSSRCARPTSFPTAPAAAAPTLPPRLDLRVAPGPRQRPPSSSPPARHAPPSWLDEAREHGVRPGHYLAFRDDDGEIVTFAIERGWTRIGRSANADLRLDDPSVSRRHALVVAEAGKPLRVLDDRSLNGVFVNGETVEWAPAERRRRAGDRPLQPLRPEALSRGAVPATPVPRIAAVNAAPNPVDPSLPSGAPGISVAADRARAELHEEIERVRLGVEEMLTEQDEPINTRPAPRTRLDPRGNPPLRQEAGPQDREEARTLGPQDRQPHPQARSAHRPGRGRPPGGRVRIHSDTERMLDGLLQEVRAIADLLTGSRSGPGASELLQSAPLAVDASAPCKARQRSDAETSSRRERPSGPVRPNLRD